MEPMRAKEFEGQNTNGWLMSEKLNGVWAGWTGSELLSKKGNKFFAPAWFTEQLPAVAKLNGELYIGRGKFEQTLSAVRKKKPIDAEWENIRYRVFEAPECRGGIETRLAFCHEILAGCSVASVIKQEICKGTAHLNEFFEGLVSAGAEGIMLHKPGCKYEGRKSNNLLKYTPLSSAEGEVISYKPGKGKHLGRVGALICKWQDKIITLGTGLSDDIREMPPRMGAQVTFTFKGLTCYGIPRHQVFVTERNYE